MGTRPPGSLPRTGTDGVVPLAVLGALAIVAGAVVMRLSSVRQVAKRPS